MATPNDGVDTGWLYYALGHMNLNRFSIGQAQPGLSVGVLSAVLTIRPSQEAEQQRIAACLSALDARLAAESAKLAALKTHKKGLMQQLFPSAEEE